MDAIAKSASHLLDIRLRASLHGPPLVLPAQTSQQSVIAEEAEQRHGRKLANAVEWGRPDGRRHRQQVEAEEVFAIAAGVDVFLQSLALERSALERGVRLHVEPADLIERAEETRIEEIAASREELPQAAARVLDACREMLHAERHLRRHRLHAEVGEQPREMGIRDFVEHHEAGVDRDRSPLLVDGDGVRMTAGGIVAVEEANVGMAMECPGATEAGDAGADDGEAFHGLSNASRSRESSPTAKSIYCCETVRHVEADIDRAGGEGPREGARGRDARVLLWPSAQTRRQVERTSTL